MSRARREPTEEELTLWRYVTRDVTPQPGGVRPAARSTPPDPTSSPIPQVAAPVAPARSRAAPAAVQAPLPLGATAGIDRATARRFARGQLTIEARLDLHGLTLSEAHSAVARFIRRSSQIGQRCVLIITGKGSGASENAGRIRREALHWLAHPGLRPSILAVREARPQHGGGGALYVLLKRQRAA